MQFGVVDAWSAAANRAPTNGGRVEPLLMICEAVIVAYRLAYPRGEHRDGTTVETLDWIG